MSTYIINLDKDIYPGGDDEARHIIESAGIVIERSFQMGLIYRVQGDEQAVSALPGLRNMELADSLYNVKLQNLNTDHLKLTVDPSNQTAYDPKYTGAGVDIYLVDTGIKTSHIEFQNATISNLYSNFGDDFDDDVGHGTAMASLIVGANIGASPNAHLYNVKLFNNTSSQVSVGEILEAFDEVLTHHLSGPTPDKTKIICAPWVSEYNALVNDAVARLLLRGVIVVCAAGNEGTDIANLSPASVHTAITVGAFNRNFEVTSFTNTPWTGSEPASPSFVNYGSALDIFALGVDVTTASIGANNDYLSATGTSVSTAIAAGIFAHYLEWFPEKNSYQQRETFLSEGHYIGTSSLVFDNQDANVDYSQVYPAVVTTENKGQNTLTSKPSGRLINVQQGQVAQTDIGLNPQATDVQILDFAPVPSWISVDLATGVVNIDTQNFTNQHVPGVYLFAMRGTVNGEVLVEEFSVGVYENEVAELFNPDTTSSYYYDTENDQYDAVVSYSLSKNGVFN